MVTGPRCPLCGTTRWNSLRRYPDYGRCLTCGLIGTKDAPAEDYDRCYFTGEDSSPGHRDFSSEWAAAYDQCRFQEELRAYPSPGSLLDIGAASGAFLKVAADLGWTPVLGVEVSEFARERARADDIPMAASLEEIGDRRFSLITLHHVLEHLTDPVATLAAAADHLERGGQLLIEVPNWGSIQRRAGGPDWIDLRPDQHRWHFGPTTLNQAVKQAGLTTRRCYTLGEPVPTRGSVLLSLGVPPRVVSSLAGRARAAAPGARQLASPSASFAGINPPQSSAFIRSTARVVDATLNRMRFNKRLVIVCDVERPS